MARDKSFGEILIEAPWWVSAIVLLLGNILIRLVIPAWFSGGRTQGPLGPAMHGAFLQAMPIMANLFSLLIAGLMVFSLIREKLQQRTVTVSDALPYKSRETLFTPAELNFLKTLEQYLNKNYRIYGKVRLCDLIETKKNLDNKSHQTAFNRISAKHVDFVICNAQSLAIEMVIELDDSTHQQSDRKARDEFLNAALGAANIPLARFSVKRAYTLSELYIKLGDFVVTTQEYAVRKAVEGAEPEALAAMPAAAKVVGRCSACGSEMKVREKMSGDEAGKKFWVCSQYPGCRSVEVFLEAGGG